MAGTKTNTEELPDITREIYRPKALGRTQVSPCRSTSGARTKIARSGLLNTTLLREPFLPSNRLPSKPPSLHLLFSAPFSENALTIQPKSLLDRPKAGLEPSKPPLSAVRRSTQSCRTKRVLRQELDKREPSPLYLTLPTEAVTRWAESMRLQFLRRSDMAARPLVIVQFTGVLGDWYSPEPWSATTSLYMRLGWLPGLQHLSSFAQIALYIDLPRSRTSQICTLLKANQVHIDAIYKPRCRKFRYLQDYSQTITDFGLNPSTQIMTLSALNMEISDMEASWERIYCPTASLKARICVQGLPIAGNRVGVVALVANPRAQEIETQVGFEEVVKALSEVIQAGTSLKVAFNRHLRREKYSFQPTVLRYRDFPGRSETGIAKTRGRLRLLTLHSNAHAGSPYIRMDTDTLEARPKSLC